jgi:hypothetical protein
MVRRGRRGVPANPAARALLPRPPEGGAATRALLESLLAVVDLLE